MTLLQAILIGLVYYINILSLGYDVFWSYFQIPLAAGFWAGLILGDVRTGVICGALIQPMYLAHSQSGGVVSTDKCAGTLIATSLVIAGGLDVSNAVVLAVPIGLVTAQLSTIRRIVFGFFAQKAEAAAMKGDTRGYYFAGVALPAIAKAILFWLPMAAMLYLGTDFITSVINGMPAFLQNAFTVIGYLLPAVGFGVMLQSIGRKDLMIYFAVGFFLFQYTKIGTMFLVLISIFLGYLHMRTERDDESSEDKVSLSEMIKEAKQQAEGNGGLKTIDLIKIFFRWCFFCEVINSFERLQGASVGLALQPTLKKFYKDQPEEYSAALTRHSQFFNTEGFFGSSIIGMVTAMEEQRSKGLGIEPEAIVSVKTSLMGPLAGIGDTINWATINPLLIAAFIPAAAEGHAWAFVVAGILTSIWCWSIGIISTIIGYRLGATATVNILSGNGMKKYMTLFSVIGLFMMGTLAAQYVHVNVGLSWAGNIGASVDIQAILDSILPGALVLLSVLGVYKYINSGKGTALKATFGLIVIGLVLGGLGILV